MTSVTVLSGLPGAGKSERLIRAVAAAKGSGRTVATFACSEAPRLQANPYTRDHRVIGCRVPGLVCALDHFVTTQEASEMLDAMPPHALAAFDEAYYFAEDIVAAWMRASHREVEVLIVTPSGKQRSLMTDSAFEEIQFSVKCQICNKNTAEGFIVNESGDATVAMCSECDEELVRKTTLEVVTKLKEQEPYPGERVLYQPVGIDECSDWKVLRTDSPRRVEIMEAVIAAAGIDPTLSTYVDVGCNTGYFCHQLSRLGFKATGVDVVGGDIAVARMMTSVIRRDRVDYIEANCYEWLRDSHHQSFDVTSSFSVYQWLMKQRSVDHALECVRWQFEMTGAVCFFEMGYSAEEFYAGKLPITIDENWMHDRFLEYGRFSKVLRFPAAKSGLQRDIFVGLKVPLTGSLAIEGYIELPPTVGSADSREMARGSSGSTGPATDDLREDESPPPPTRRAYLAKIFKR